MSITCDNIVFTYDSNIEEMITEVKDPLENLDVYMENPKYYRLNETIFAEPIMINNENAVDDADVADEVCLIGNLIVKKRAGKRNKYIINAGDTLTNPKCPQSECNKTFPTTTLLRAHIRRVHCAERDRYVCEQCGAAFSAGYLLQRHMSVHSEQRAECPLCGKMLSTRTSMSVHVRRHGTVRPHECPVCRKSFVRRAALTTHVRFVHRTGELRCRTCGQGFPSRKLLMNHKSCRLK